MSEELFMEGGGGATAITVEDLGIDRQLKNHAKLIKKTTLFLLRYCLFVVLADVSILPI